MGEMISNIHPLKTKSLCNGASSVNVSHCEKLWLVILKSQRNMWYIQTAINELKINSIMVSTRANLLQKAIQKLIKEPSVGTKWPIRTETSGYFQRKIKNFKKSSLWQALPGRI